ncbi:uncharacterized protein RSE6_13343 [Rhynchosporium secalis]|uniref:Uncharacterized protein n=1 Tax=Rhynchosporium secalis TaxID=38038 RepID=A0A1E1MSM6_RHYSE|nr:uncharacterized protein RSE6_13343 [Rhynchosporium secalis]
MYKESLQVPPTSAMEITSRCMEARNLGSIALFPGAYTGGSIVTVDWRGYYPHMIRANRKLIVVQYPKSNLLRSLNLVKRLPEGTLKPHDSFMALPKWQLSIRRVEERDEPIRYGPKTSFEA